MDSTTETKIATIRPAVEGLVEAGIPLHVAQREFRKLYVKTALAQTEAPPKFRGVRKGNQSAAARNIGMHRNSFSRILAS